MVEVQGSWFITNLSRIICHYTCLLQFNKLSDSESHAATLASDAYAGILLQGSPLHAIFAAVCILISHATAIKT